MSNLGEYNSGAVPMRALFSGDIQSTVSSLAFWMGFMGWFYVIFGAIYSITIIYLIFGVPSLVAGLSLNKGADLLKEHVQSNDPEALHKALKELKKFFLIFGIMLIIGLVVMAIGIVVMIALLSTGSFTDLIKKAAESSSDMEVDL